MELGSPKAVSTMSQCWPPCWLRCTCLSPIVCELHQIQPESGTRVDSNACWMPGAWFDTSHGPPTQALVLARGYDPTCTTPVIPSADHPPLCSAFRPPILPLFPPLSLTNHHHPLFLYCLIPLGSATSNFPMARALGGTPSANCHGRKAVCLSPGGREF